MPEIKLFLAKIKYKIKRFFTKKKYVTIDGVCLDISENRYMANMQTNEGKEMDDFLKTKGVKINTVVDLGACYGEVSLYFSKQYPNAKILAIEPSTWNLKTFKDNKKRQNFNTDNIIILKEAVSDKKGTVKITKVLGKENSILNIKGRTEKVDADTLDSIIKRFGINQIDFMKIDIEKAEPLLYDSLKILIKQINAILIETIDEKLIKLFLDNGMKKYQRSTNDDLWFIK